MNSIMFGGKIVMVMHIVTIEVKDSAWIMSLSNGLVLSEAFETEEQSHAIAKKLAFIDIKGASGNETKPV